MKLSMVAVGICGDGRSGGLCRRRPDEIFNESFHRALDIMRGFVECAGGCCVLFSSNFDVVVIHGLVGGL